MKRLVWQQTRYLLPHLLTCHHRQQFLTHWSLPPSSAHIKSFLLQGFFQSLSISALHTHAHTHTHTHTHARAQLDVCPWRHFSTKGRERDKWLLSPHCPLEVLPTGFFRGSLAELGPSWSHWCPHWMLTFPLSLLFFTFLFWPPGDILLRSYCTLSFWPSLCLWGNPNQDGPTLGKWGTRSMEKTGWSFKLGWTRLKRAVYQEKSV